MTVYAEWWWRGVPKEKDRKNMSDYISRQAAIDAIEKHIRVGDVGDSVPFIRHGGE